MTPESKTRTGSLLVSSYTIIFSEPTIVVRRSFEGASHASSTCAMVADGNSRLMNATSGVYGKTQQQLSAETYAGFSPSRYRRIEKACGPRSQVTLTSVWWSPRLTRLVEMK